MKRIYLKLLLLLLLGITLNPQAFAQGAAGEIMYEHLSGVDYRVIITIYTDCSGPAEPSTLPLCFENRTNSSANFNTTATLFAGGGNTVPVGCGIDPTQCDNPFNSLPGYRLWRYTANVSLPTTGDWRISTFLGTRITNTNLVAAPLQLETYFDNTGGTNNSCFFIGNGIFYCVEDVPFSLGMNALDVDGDSLAYEITNVLTAPAQCSSATNAVFTSATPAYSIPLNPFQTDNSVTLGVGGQLAFLPTEAGVYAFAIKVSEYRNSVLIGATVREMRVNVFDASVFVNNPTVAINPASCLTNATVSGDTVTGMYGQQMNFCFQVQHTLPSAEYWVTDDNATAFPTSSLTYTGQMTNNVTGTFNWTPLSLSDTGYHELTLFIADNSCAGNLTFSDKIYVYVPGPVSVSNVQKNAAVQLYPNPNNGRFTLKAADLNNKKLALINTMGQMIESDIQAINDEIMLPNNLPDGIYTLKVYSPGSVQTIPFVLSR